MRADSGTVLHCAAEYGFETVTRLLLDRGADIDAKNANGVTALDLEAKNGREATARLLRDRIATDK